MSVFRNRPALGLSLGLRLGLGLGMRGIELGIESKFGSGFQMVLGFGLDVCLHWGPELGVDLDLGARIHQDGL